MEFLSVDDRFSLNSHDYLLKTTDEADVNRISVTFFRQGEVIHTFRLPYEAQLPESRRTQLVAEYHQRHKDELARLFQFHRQHAELELDTGACHLLACGFLKYGMVHEAISSLEALMKANRATPGVHAALGEAYLKSQQYARALDHLRLALSARGNYADLHFQRGVCEYHLQRCEEAVGAFMQAIEINPHYGEAYFYLGLALLLNARLAQNYELAVDLAERASRLFCMAQSILAPLRGESFTRGIEVLKQENFEEAFRALSPLTAHIANHKPEIVNYEFHLRVLDEAERIRPEQVWQEIKRLQALLERYPNYPDLYHEVGFAYAVLAVSVGSKAILLYEKALELNPAFADAQKSLRLLRNDQRGFRSLLRAMLRLER